MVSCSCCVVRSVRHVWSMEVKFRKFSTRWVTFPVIGNTCLLPVLVSDLRESCRYYSVTSVFILHSYSTCWRNSRILWNPNVVTVSAKARHWTYVEPVQSIHTLVTCFSKFRLNIILSSMSWSHKWSLLLGFIDEKDVRISHCKIRAACSAHHILQASCIWFILMRVKCLAERNPRQGTEDPVILSVAMCRPPPPVPVRRASFLTKFTD
jgi:hypothetical protein